MEPFSAFAILVLDNWLGPILFLSRLQFLSQFLGHTAFPEVSNDLRVRPEASPFRWGMVVVPHPEPGSPDLQAGGAKSGRWYLIAIGIKMSWDTIILYIYIIIYIYIYIYVNFNFTGQFHHTWTKMNLFAGTFWNSQSCWNRKCRARSELPGCSTIMVEPKAIHNHANSTLLLQQKLNNSIWIRALWKQSHTLKYHQIKTYKTSSPSHHGIGYLHTFRFWVSHRVQEGSSSRWGWYRHPARALNSHPRHATR